MTLFSEHHRADPRPKHSPETSFEFYERVAGPFWDDVRSLLNEWFSQLPFPSQAGLRARFRSKDWRQFEGAFWELYLHELFRRLDFAVYHEPSLQRAGLPPATPDFLLRRGDESVYVEAVVVADSDDDNSADRLRIQLADAINERVQSQFFTLWLEIEQQGNSNLPYATIARELRNWIGSLTPDRVLTAQRTTGRFDGPAHSWIKDDWHLRFVAIAKEPEDRGRTCDRIVGIYPSRSPITDASANARLIRNRLRDKAKKYAELHESLVLALLIRRSFCRESEVQHALFGSGGVGPELLTSGRIITTLAGDWDGFWATRYGPRHRDVSAVLCARNLQPHTVGEISPKLWVCPWANTQMTVDLDVDVVNANRDRASLEILSAKRSAREIFNLPKQWPSGDPFPTAGSAYSVGEEPNRA